MSNSESTSAINATWDWYLCFLCRSDLREPTTNPSTSVKFKKKNSERILACYEKVIDNIRQLNELGELPNSIFTGDIISHYLRARVQVRTPLENHKLYGFLYGISNWTPRPW